VVRVWDGDDWVEVDNFRVTGENQQVYRLTLYDGSQVTATPYHRFLLSNGETVEMDELQVGDELMPSDAPLSHGDIAAKGAYVKGFMLGDGSLKGSGSPLVWIYPPKRACAKRLVASLFDVDPEDARSDAIQDPGINSNLERWALQGLACRKSLVPWCREYKYGLPAEVFAWDKQSKLELLAGLFDADGTAMDTKNGFGYQLSSVSCKLLRDVQTLLKTVGVQSKIQNKPARTGGERDFGRRGGVCVVQPLWRLTINQKYSILLAGLATFSRLTSFVDRSVVYNVKSKATRIIEIEKVLPIEDKVYCCTITEGDDVFSLSCGIRTRQCAEIPLAIWGGFCLIGDVVPYFARDFEESLVAVRTMARFLVRTNLMRSLYADEVRRTNRIGVSLTGIHEYAWKQFNLTFHDMITPGRAKEFWRAIAELSQAAVQEADSYSQELGLVAPETVTTIKPSGSVSKLFALTEGAHLPSRLFYLRWVQYRSDDPLVERFRSLGYPVRGPLRTYNGTMIVGFPTDVELARIMPPELVVTAADATPSQQVMWVRMLEYYWLEGGGAHPKRAGQVSYTLKYDPSRVSLEQFRAFQKEHMSTIKAMSVMPLSDSDNAAYEYLPEEPISLQEFQELKGRIQQSVISEDVDFKHVDCASGACPVNFQERFV
jgi:hypothetical protein